MYTHVLQEWECQKVTEANNRFICVCEDCVSLCECFATFKPDNQWHFQLQLPTGLGDAIGDDRTVDDPTKDVDKDGLHLRQKRQRTN